MMSMEEKAVRGWCDKEVGLCLKRAVADIDNGKGDGTNWEITVAYTD